MPNVYIIYDVGLLKVGNIMWDALGEHFSSALNFIYFKWCNRMLWTKYIYKNRWSISSEWSTKADFHPQIQIPFFSTPHPLHQYLCFFFLKKGSVPPPINCARCHISRESLVFYSQRKSRAGHLSLEEPSASRWHHAHKYAAEWWLLRIFGRTTLDLLGGWVSKLWRADNKISRC